MCEFGKCDFCGAEAELTCVGDDNICPECLSYYISCDHCNEYYPKEDTIVYYLKNGDVYCEDCAIYALNFSGLTDDDVDHIEYPEGYEEEDEE